MKIAVVLYILLLVAACSRASRTAVTSDEQNTSGSAGAPDSQITVDEVVDQLTLSIGLSFDSATDSPITSQSTIDFSVSGLEQVSRLTFYRDSSCQTQLSQFDTPAEGLSDTLPLPEVGQYDFYYTGVLTDERTIACRSAGLSIYKITVGDLSLVYDTADVNDSMWNFWVREDDPTTTCPGNNVDCIHAGLKRKVTITGYDKCENLSATDSLNAFNWVCQEGSGAIDFVLEDFLPQKGLSDLILTTGFRAISLTVTGGIGTIATNSTTSLWGDSITAGPTPNASPTSLSLSNTIYYYTADDNLAGYFEFTNPSVSLVLLNDSKMTHTLDTQYMVYSNGRDFLWVEGEFVGFGSGGSTETEIVRTLVATHVRVHNSILSNSNADGFDISGGYQVSVTDTTISGCAGQGIFVNQTSERIILRDLTTFLNGSHGVNSNAISSRISNVYTTLNGGAGLRTETSSEMAILQDIYSYSNSGQGVILATPALIANRIFAVGNGDHGFVVSDDKLLVNHVTSALNNVSGISLVAAAEDLRLTSYIAFNNEEDGVSTFADNTNVIKDLIASRNSTSGLSFGGGSDTQFKGFVLIDDNGTECNSTGGTSNLDDVTCANSGADPEVFLSTNLDPGNLFEGALVDGDASHPDDALIDAGDGVVAYNSLTSFTEFSQKFYGISLAIDNNILNSLNRDECSSGVNCGFWSLALKSNDTGDIGGGNIPIARNRFSCPTGNDTVTHVFSASTFSSSKFYESAVEVSGDAIGDDDDVCEDNEDCSFTFLESAVEIERDLVGNDNGLCESNEACIYTPNIGGYQGQGNLIPSTCAAIGSSGSIVNVTLHQYETN